jgi:1-acyl-sn-glycerol-3-phosphate acyltransferase
MKENQLQRSKFTQTLRQCLSDLVYAFFKFSLNIIFRLRFKVRVLGRENLPSHGPLLVAANHLSEWDPPFLGSFLPWQVHWVAKVELFELLNGKMNFFFRMLHCIPVDREKADLAAIRQVVKVLKEPRPVLVFAEGGVRTDDTSLLGTRPELKEGAAMMALLSKTKILPILINGTVSLYDWRTWFSFRRQLLEVVIGPVFELSDKDRAKATQEILANLLRLKPLLKQKQIS